MNIIDCHCDFLLKLYENAGLNFGIDSDGSDVTFPRLAAGGVALQIFAIFLPDLQKPGGFGRILEYIDLFRNKVASHPGMAFVRTRSEWMEARNNKKIGALLSLEGVDGLEGNLAYLRTLYYLGVRSIGITWNHANWAADGIGETRGGGFTLKGRQLVKECNRLGMLLDVSHLSEAGFWELVELSDKPFLASHSNTRRWCGHRRNLTDEQLSAVIAADGRVGITFVPWFVKAESPAISDILSHIDHICSLGGSDRIVLGSDFDGIDERIPDLEHPGKYPRLAEELHKHYSSEEAKKFLFGNMNRFLLEHLPDKEE